MAHSSRAMLPAATLSLALATLSVTGCGRIGFDPVAVLDGGMDATADSSVSDTLPNADAMADGGVAPAPFATAVGGSGNEDAWGVGVDSAGNIYAAGRFDGDLTIGDDTFTSMGMNDAWVASLAPDGAPRWARAFGGPDLENAFGVAVGPDDGVYVTGTVTGPVDLGLGPTTPGASGDLFVIRYATGGEVDWAMRYAESGFSGGTYIAFDDAMDPIVTGMLGGSGDLGLGTVDAAMGADALILGLRKEDGATRFVWNWGGDQRAEGRGVASGGGGIVVVGQLEGDIDFGGGALAVNPPSDGFIAAFDPSGGHRWSFLSGAAGGLAQDVVLDGAGNAYALFTTVTAADFGGRVSIPTSSGVVLALDASGAYRWSRSIPGTVPRDAVLCGGLLWVVGRAGSNPVDAGGGPLPSFGDTDAFWAVYELDGSYRDSGTMGGPQGDSAVALDCAPDASLVIAGRFGGTASLAGFETVVSGGQDAFVLRLIP